jgi:membrane associated rhomboid family serine protease
MIIPIGHEQTTVRRLPWVTFVVMLLCAVTFLVLLPEESTRDEQSNRYWNESIEYFFEHPYLELDSRFREFLASQIGEEFLATEIDRMRRQGPIPPGERLLAEEQETFDIVVDKFFAAVDGSPSRVLGVVPADLRLYSLLTYQFVHGGWLHLIFNLIFLFVTGPFIEDVWGRPLYTTFYLMAGIVSAVMYAVRYPDLSVPLIGASGAIAGVMGAFLVRFMTARVRFLIWLGVPIGPFRAPAWVIFPFWFVLQLFMAQLMDIALPESGGGGVAFWAHVWGFVFGAVVAVGMAYFKIEDRFLHGAIESKVTLIDNTAIESASAQADGGDVAGAVAALENELAAAPDNVDAAMALWNLCFKHDLTATALPHMLRAMRTAVQRGDELFVLAHWEDVLRGCGAIRVEPGLALRIAELLARDGRDDSARDTLELAFAATGESTPAGLRLRLARMGLSLEMQTTAAMVDAALADPELPTDAREELESARHNLGPAPEIAEEPAAEASADVVHDEPIAVGDVNRTLQTVEGIPRALDDRTLQVDVGGALRVVGLDTIQAVAVGGIARSGERPIVLVDLLLDSPWGDRPALRSVRLLSNAFDPRSLVEADNPMAAFQKLLDLVLQISDAVPLPDPDAARGRPFRSFPSIEAYQREVLNVTS